MTGPARLRALLRDQAMVIAPGAYDDIRTLEHASPVPLIDGALGHISAVVSQKIPSGDHAIILCDVTSAQATGSGAPLLYCRRGYHSLHHGL